jgi:hypothetical protein
MALTTGMTVMDFLGYRDLKFLMFYLVNQPKILGSQEAQYHEAKYNPALDGRSVL